MSVILQSVRCPSCDGVRVLIDRMDHARASTCGTCGGRGRVPLITMDAELCPFCGQPAYQYPQAVDDGWQIVCSQNDWDCCRGPVRKTAREACDAWNMRQSHVPT